MKIYRPKIFFWGMIFCLFQYSQIFVAHGGMPPQRGGRVVIYYGGGSPIHFNSAVQSGTSTALVGTQLFASLVRYEQDWTPKPYLAKKWEVSSNGLQVTFDIVENATFHDGKPVTADDVAFSIKTVKNNHPFKSMFASVKDIKTSGPYRIKLILSHPHPALFLCMSPALLPIIPKHIYGNGKDIRNHPANLKPVGSGPFKLIDYQPGKLIKLGRFDKFFIAQRPYLDEITIRLVREPSTQMIALQREDGHILAPFIDYVSLDTLKSQPHLTLTSKGYDAIGPIVWLAFNLKREPMNDRRVRQAIAYAMDHDFIINSMHQGRALRADGPLTPASPFYYKNVTKYFFNLDKANALLDAANLLPGPDGIRFETSIDYIPALPSQHKDIAYYLKRQLLKVGIKIHIRKSQSFPEWVNRISNWDFDMTLDSVYNWGDPVIGVHRTYHSSNIRKGVIWSNTQNYRNKEIDRILENAATEMDTERRNELYNEFQRIITEDLPVIWLNVLPFHTIYHKQLGSPPVSIWGLHSPLDTMHWKQLPSKSTHPISTSFQWDENSSFEKQGKHLIELLKTYELDVVLDFIRKPENGFLNLRTSGLHAMGFTVEGVVFFDNSGQMRPGMEINGIKDLNGNNILPMFINASKGEKNGYLKLDGVWPNPASNKLTPASFWCGQLNSQDIICLMKWKEEG